jgi:hypothetical protein
MIGLAEIYSALSNAFRKAIVGKSRPRERVSSDFP